MQADTHSRVVFWLKILLPLAALAILSTLFLFSRNFSPEGFLPFSEVDVEELAREQRLTAPEYAGIARDGASISIKAQTARPDPLVQGGASAEGIEATYARGGEFSATLTASAGRIDTAADRLDLTGDVEIITSTGYRVDSEALTARLDRTEVVSPGPVRAEAPYGEITADTMRLSANEAAGGETGAEVLVFKGGVRLIYDPSKTVPE